MLTTEEMIEQFNQATQDLKSSGSDLNRIKIALRKDAVASYLTRRIREDIDNEPQDHSDN